jgi:phosphatidylglycerophosphate synthase
VTLGRVRELARKRPEQEFFINRLYGAHLSPYFTVVCLRLGLSPDQVTLVGGTIGALGVALLFLPIGAWSVVAVVALQIGYILDFSDGQVARLTGRTSLAGAYLDWLTHFYIPVGAALATAASIAWSAGWYPYLVLGMLAALELGAFAFSCREHVLIALGRRDPALAATAAYHAALADDARPTDVLDAPAGPAAELTAAGISGRRHAPTWRSIVGELLIYPGAVHLLSVAVLVDLLLQVLGLVLPVPVSARGALVAAWAALLLVHAPIAIRRGHRVITAVETRAAARATAPGAAPTAAPASSDRA